MPESQYKYRFNSGKRTILVAEDELINREILGEILKSEYNVLFAKDGQETLDMIRQNASNLSLVLLDIQMPVISGLDVLKELKGDPGLSNIPVIVMTSERSAEVESLRLGATDFIPKPYPPVDVIHARILRTIELFEDRDIIYSTERDSLTGLYNREFFYRYAEQFDHLHPGTATDAVIVDINHFRMINERYGKTYGDEILRKIADQLRSAVETTGGIVCRRSADTFLMYGPHREDYEEILEAASVRLTNDESSENRVRIRMGVYSNTDHTLEMERRFDRAIMAADTVKDSFTRAVGTYDEDMHQRQLYAEQLVEDFPIALRENHFKVFYQPKFDIRPDTPTLSSAEALVRWYHPKLGMISPGVFIPLFEENGLIQKLDNYVWKEAARQIRDWKDRLGYSVPISVNVSRVDLYDPKLHDNLRNIINEQGLECSDMRLEVTESAYIRDTARIISAVESLRSMGFKIEMDDFGTGYSSLNMISKLPIDTLKLDMHFIHDAFREDGNTHMLEIVIAISDYLSVPVIAEGVETEEQLHVLKSMGCELVQGYFFSKPVPASEFEAFILQKKESELAGGGFSDAKKESDDPHDEIVRKAKLDLIRDRMESEDSSGEGGSAAEDTSEHRRGLRLKATSIIFAVLALISAAALFITDNAVTKGYQRMEAATARYAQAQMTAADLQTGSDYLTDRVRSFVVTGQISYLNDFIEEVDVTRRRDKAVEKLRDLLEGEDDEALESINTALRFSNELVGVENHAMRLILETGDYDLSEIPDEITEVQLTPEEKAMSQEELKAKAESLVFDDAYMDYKERISSNISLGTQSFIQSSSQELSKATASLSAFVRLQTIVLIVFLALVIGIVLLLALMVLNPINDMVAKMQRQQTITPAGVEELRFVARIYNDILQENREVRERLSNEASTDALTGLFNRGAYDLLMESTDREHMALILLDVDYFKNVNDTYGHAVGDKILVKVADLLRASFRSVDILCRVGGDEFVVVMTRVSSTMNKLVRSKIERINYLLQNPTDELPPVSLSVGVAFSDRKHPAGDIFHDADTALYQVKEAGRNGCIIFDEEDKGQDKGQ